MSYEFATEDISYEDYASGRVLYNQKGTTSFPARLISEIFQRCVAYLEKQGKSAPYTIYDPLCGGAYSLTILGFLHPDLINKIIASDAMEDVVIFAKKNLSLLTEAGMQDRINQIKQYLADYGKESHAEALESAYKFESIIKNMPHSININCYQADALTDSIKLDKLKPDALKTDALEPDALMPDALKPDTLKLNTLKPDALNLVTLKQDQSEMNDKIDIVITDIPYGKLVEWITEDGKDAVSVMLQNLLPKLSKQSIVAVSSRKRTAIYNDNYTRVSKFQIGKRQIVLLRPNS